MPAIAFFQSPDLKLTLCKRGQARSYKSRVLPIKKPQPFNRLRFFFIRRSVREQRIAHLASHLLRLDQEPCERWQQPQRTEHVPQQHER